MSIPIDAFGDELKRRMENPFWGSFIISWLLINWKVVYITLSWSSQKIDDKIQYIENLYNFGVFGFHNAYLLLILYPIIASAFAIGLVPFISYFYIKIDSFHRKRINSIKINELDTEIVLVDKQEQLARKNQTISNLEKTEQELWAEEYKEIEESGVISELAKFIFLYNGRRYSPNGDNISVFDFANASRFGLIQESRDNIFLLTKKGEFILRKYPSDKLKEFLVEDIPF